MKKLVAVVLFAMTTATCLLAETTITVLYKGSSEWESFIQEIKKRYEKAHPDIKIKLYPIITQNDDNYDIKGAMVLKSDSSVDLALTGISLHKYIKAGYLEAYPDMQTWKDWPQFYQYLKTYSQEDGKYYAIPVCSGNLMLYYNTSVFQKAGIQIPWKPANWEDILKAARTIKEKCPGVYPFWCSLQGNTETTTMFTALMLLNGTTDKFYENGRWIVTSNGLLDTLKFIAALRKDKLIPPGPIIFDPNSPSKMQKEYTPAQKIGIFMDGGWFKKLIWTGNLEKNKKLL